MTRIIPVAKFKLNNKKLNIINFLQGTTTTTAIFVQVI